MIPHSITREHVEKAIADIRSGGVPKKREPTKFYLVHEGRLYPPKFAISLAANYATGKELLADVFSGGDEANSYLTGLGFEIQSKRDDWSWKECYFAVWGYDQLDLDPIQVKAVLYREISELIGRTAKSVEFKLQNISSFDPRPREQKPIAKLGERCKQAEYAMAVYQGIVREVYRIDAWHDAGTMEYLTRDTTDFSGSGRKEFSGEVAYDVRDRFVGKSVGKGGQNPIRYANC